MIRSAPSSLGGEDRHQADRSVADDRDRLARAGLGGDGGEPAGAEHVGGGQQGRDQLRVRLSRRRHQRAVGVRDAGLLRLRADRLRDELGVHALGLEPGPADLAGVVGDDERPDDEVADLDVLHLASRSPRRRRRTRAPSACRPVELSTPRYGHRSEPQMQVAVRRMTASVGSTIFGSSRSSTRTSPGACMTTPRMTSVLQASRTREARIDRAPPWNRLPRARGRSRL